MIEGYPKPCTYPSFEDNPFTMGLRLCDDNGMCAGEYIDVLNRLRHLSGHDPYDGAPYACTGHAHLAGEHVECLSPAHDADEAAQIRALAVDTLGSRWDW